MYERRRPAALMVGAEREQTIEVAARIAAILDSASPSVSSAALRIVYAALPAARENDESVPNSSHDDPATFKAWLKTTSSVSPG